MVGKMYNRTERNRSSLNSLNDLNPKTSYVICKAYVIPRLLYRLEVISLKKIRFSS